MSGLMSFTRLISPDPGRFTSFGIGLKPSIATRLLVYVLSRISMSIFGSTPFGLRFPSMLEFYFGSVAILLYVRRKAGLAFAAVAVLMLWAAAPTLYYAVEARPYALIFLSFACLLLAWDTAITPQPRRLALFGVAASTLALAISACFCSVHPICICCCRRRAIPPSAQAGLSTLGSPAPTHAQHAFLYTTDPGIWRTRRSRSGFL